MGWREPEWLHRLNTLQNLLGSPAIAYLLLGVLFLEAAVLLMLWRFSQTGLPPAQTLSFLGAGAAFSMALLVVLSGGSPAALAVALCAAFAFHLLDLWLRWPR